jgi:hypothetical protein
MHSLERISLSVIKEQYETAIPQVAILRLHVSPESILFTFTTNLNTVLEVCSCSWLM